MRFTAGVVIDQLSFPTGLSRPALTKLISILVQDDRFMNTRRRKLLASDLGSLLHAILINQAAQSVEYDKLLRSLVFKGSWPQGRRAVFPTRTWGETIDFMIQHAPPAHERASKPANGKIRPGSLPHQIEVITNLPYVSLIWLGPDGKPVQRDGYGLKKATPSSILIARKSVIDGRIINILGDILRISVGDAAAMQRPDSNAAALRPGRAAAEARTTTEAKAPAGYQTIPILSVREAEFNLSPAGFGSSHSRVEGQIHVSSSELRYAAADAD